MDTIYGRSQGMPGQQWRFPGNDNGEIKGINDAGVHTFSANSFRSLIRESVQNSLDAAIDLKRPVEVELELSTMARESFPGYQEFAQVLKACADISADSADASAFFSSAIEVFERPKITVLRISDYGTYGLTGADTCAKGTHWSRLVKESGSSNKSATSGGSYGIGKYATFACSDFRTVFFSSRDKDDIESSIGVTRLVSFRNPNKNDQMTAGVGYFSDNEFNTATHQQLDLPGAKKRAKGQSGTDAYIVGFKEREDFVMDALLSVLEDFLVSLWKGKLIVRVVVDDVTLSVDKDTLSQYMSCIPIDTDDTDLLETIQHFKLLDNIGSSGVHETIFDPKEVAGVSKFGWKKGDCRLVFMEGDGLNRRVMITRAAGMRLFNRGNISGSIYFTGVLLIEGEDMNRDFREMEAPSHDSWSPEHAKDSKLAKKKINALYKWIKQTVVATLSKPIAEMVDAYGTSILLPQREALTSDEGTSETLETEPIGIKVKPTTPKKEDSKASELADISPDAGGTAVRKGKGKGKGGPRNAGTAGGEDEGFIFVPVKQRLMGSGQKGRYRVRIDVPKTATKAQVRFNIKGEKDSFPAVLKSALIVKGSSNITQIKGDKVCLENLTEGESLVIEFSPDFDQYCQMEVNYYAAE